MKRTKLLHMLALLFLATASGSQAQTTTFTYQGRLNVDNSPANGSYDFVFQIFDAASGGASIGGLLVTNAVPVNNGLFTVPLDFGSTPFTGPARWLDVAVRSNGVGSYTTLDPRTQLTPTPYAIYASKSGTVSNGAIGNAQLGANAIAEGNLQNGAITAGKIATGQVVKNLNGLTDSVVLTQGANVTITTNGNSLQISAPAGGLTLPYTGSGSSASQLFSLTNTGSGSAIFGKSATTGSEGKLATVLEGVRGESAATYGSGVGGYYYAANNNGVGVHGEHVQSGNYGQLGYPFRGVFGRAAQPTHVGVDGTHAPSGNYGYLGTADSGVFGRHVASGDYGALGSASGYGVFGQAASAGGRGVAGMATSTAADSVGVKGVHQASGNHGELGTANFGVYGNSTAATGSGVKGQHSPSGVYGQLGYASKPFDIQTVAGVYGSSGGSSALAGLFDGNVSVNGTLTTCVLTITGGCDLAEPFQMSGHDIPKGAVVSIDKLKPGQLKLSDQPYDKRVAGIVSGANGVNPGISLSQQGVLEGGQDVALSGRVYALAEASQDEIEPGDLLTTSAIPGHCMKVTDHSKAQGAIIGKAMSSLKQRKGFVLVLVSLQ